MRNDIRRRKVDILRWVEDGESKAFMCRQLRCKPDTLNAWLTRMDIEYSGVQGGRGKDSPYKISLLEYLRTEHPRSHRIRLKLLDEGIKEHRCEGCDNTTWNGRPVPLELHHVDFNRFNNALDNLRLLCPNCHAQQPGNSGDAMGVYEGVT